MVLVVAAVLAAACGDGDSVSEAGDAADQPATSVEASPTSELADSSEVAPTTVPTAVSGRALPVFEGQPDAAIGEEAPVALGSDLLTGETISAAVADQPMVIAFFAHWCPHCQREVQELTAWLESNTLPAGVDFLAVSTFEDAERGNHPPAKWLGDEGWTYPVFADTDGFAVAEAFGVPSIPFWVVLNADGTVAGRVAGNLGPEELVDLFITAGGQPST